MKLDEHKEFGEMLKKVKTELMRMKKKKNVGVEITAIAHLNKLRKLMDEIIFRDYSNVDFSIKANIYFGNDLKVRK